MKFTIERNTLLTGLQSIIGVVERRQTMPILSHVLLDLAGDQLILAGTDMEIEMRCRVPVLSGDEGKTTVPARKLHDICRGLPEGVEINFKADDKQMVVTCGRSRYRLAMLPADEFPEQGVLESAAEVSLESTRLATIIGKTSFAMGATDVRSYLNGLLLELAPDRVRAVATDGHRLALCDSLCEVSVTDKSSYIIPNKAVQGLTGLLEANETVIVRLTDIAIQVVSGHLRMTSKLLSGRYPDYERVIPAESKGVVTGDRDEFRAALARSAILANEKFRGVRLNISSAEMGLSSHNAEQEESDDAIEVEYTGNEMCIGFNLGYLGDALSAMAGSKFEMMVTNPDTSCVLREPGNTLMTMVVMPMRL